VISSLTLKNFRNFEDASFEFDFQNLIVGGNGKGKTNIIEALSLFSRPLIEVPFEDLLQAEKDFFYV